MSASRNFGHNSAIKAMGIYLRSNDIRKGDKLTAFPYVTDNGGARFVAGSFNSKNQHFISALTDSF
jgi:hypothetical protein